MNATNPPKWTACTTKSPPGGVVVLIHSVACYTKYGEHTGNLFSVKAIDRRDYQKPIEWCGHNHRSYKAAMRCFNRLRSKYEALALAEAREVSHV